MDIGNWSIHYRKKQREDLWIDLTVPYRGFPNDNELPIIPSIIIMCRYLVCIGPLKPNTDAICMGFLNLQSDPFSQIVLQEGKHWAWPVGQGDRSSSNKMTKSRGKDPFSLFPSPLFILNVGMVAGRVVAILTTVR